MKSPKMLSFLALSVALGLAGTGAAVQAQTNPETSRSADMDKPAAGDAWITTKVKSELAMTKGVPSTDVSVQTADGVVTLTGVLPSKIAVNKAVAAAKSVKGVKEVDATGLKTK